MYTVVSVVSVVSVSALGVVVEVVCGGAALQVGRGGVGRGRAGGGGEALGLHAPPQPLDEPQALQRVGGERRRAHLQRLRDQRGQLRTETLPLHEPVRLPRGRWSDA